MIDIDRLNDIKIENYIFIIYYIIITISLYANKVDKEKFEGFKKEKVNINEQKYGKEIREKYRKLLFVIFGMAFLVYLYYTISNYDDYIEDNNPNSKRLNGLTFLASFLVLISGTIYLYVIYEDKDVNIELAFN